MKATDYKREYNKQNYARVPIYFSKEQKEIIQTYCDERNMSVSEFIKGLIEKEIGGLLDEAKAAKTVNPVKVYLTETCTILAVCGEKWLHTYPNKSGMKFGINITSTAAPHQLSDMFIEKKVDEKLFNRWQKIFSANDEYYSSGEDFSSMAELSEKIGFRRYWLLYDSTGREQLTFPDGE